VRILSWSPGSGLKRPLGPGVCAGLLGWLVGARSGSGEDVRRLEAKELQVRVGRALLNVGEQLLPD
jgi:hypothetical protein